MITNRELNKKLRILAINNGLCAQWQKAWEKDWNNAELVNKFYKGIDFFLKTRFIPNDFFNKNVSVDFLRTNGIVVGDAYSLINPSRAIIMGESDATIRVNGNHLSVVYILDNSKVKLVAKNNSHVIVHMFNNASVFATRFDGARICIINHSENTIIAAETGVVVKQELNYLKKDTGPQDSCDP